MHDRLAEMLGGGLLHAAGQDAALLATVLPALLVASLAGLSQPGAASLDA